MDIANLVISILSLLATITISFLIYYLDRHNQKLAKEKEIREEAKMFILDNSEEIEYLPWATIAAGCFFQNKHIRKIYNNFAYLDDEVKLEVLNQRKLNCELIKDDKWIFGKIIMLQNAIHDLEIGDDFLYDCGKYFTRSYKYKDKSVKDLEEMRYDHAKYDDYFNVRPAFCKQSDKLTYEQYLEDYLYCKFEKPELMPKNIKVIMPNDYLISLENLRYCAEDYLCYWIMIMVENVICYSIRYLHYNEFTHSKTDAQVRTYEDMYFSVWYELYYLKKR